MALARLPLKSLYILYLATKVCDCYFFLARNVCESGSGAPKLDRVALEHVELARQRGDQVRRLQTEYIMIGCLKKSCQHNLGHKIITKFGTSGAEFSHGHDLWVLVIVVNDQKYIFRVTMSFPGH